MRALWGREVIKPLMTSFRIRCSSLILAWVCGREAKPEPEANLSLYSCLMKIIIILPIQDDSQLYPLHSSSSHLFLLQRTMRRRTAADPITRDNSFSYYLNLLNFGKIIQLSFQQRTFSPRTRKRIWIILISCRSVSPDTRRTFLCGRLLSRSFCWIIIIKNYPDEIFIMWRKRVATGKWIQVFLWYFPHPLLFGQPQTRPE